MNDYGRRGDRSLDGLHIEGAVVGGW